MRQIISSNIFWFVIQYFISQNSEYFLDFYVIPKQTDVGENLLDLYPWMDWKNIPPYHLMAKRGLPTIQSANIFLSVVSLDTVVSEIWTLQIEHAIQYNEQLAPAVWRNVAEAQVCSTLLVHHCFSGLLIDVWIRIWSLPREHTRLLTLAIECVREPKPMELYSGYLVFIAEPMSSNYEESLIVTSILAIFS